MLKWIQTVSAAAGKADFSVFLPVVDVKYGSEQHKNSLTLDPETTARWGKEREKKEKREAAAENCREAVIVADRRFQDNITALKGVAASRCKHPKLAARRAAAYEKSLMWMMLAAREQAMPSHRRVRNRTANPAKNFSSSSDWLEQGRQTRPL